MANPNQARDARGRFASVGTRTDAADRREAEADQRRVQRARAESDLEGYRAELSTVTRRLAAMQIDKPTKRDDPHDNVAWEQERAKLRARQRLVRGYMKALASSIRKNR